MYREFRHPYRRNKHYVHEDYNHGYTPRFNNWNRDRDRFPNPQLRRPQPQDRGSSAHFNPRAVPYVADNYFRSHSNRFYHNGISKPLLSERAGWNPRTRRPEYLQENLDNQHLATLRTNPQDTEDHWRTVHKRRPSATHPNRRRRKPLSDFDCSVVNRNRYFCLDSEDDFSVHIPAYEQALVNYPQSHSLSHPHRYGENENRIRRQPKNDPRTSAKDSRLHPRTKLTIQLGNLIEAYGPENDEEDRGRQVDQRPLARPKSPPATLVGKRGEYDAVATPTHSPATEKLARRSEDNSPTSSVGPQYRHMQGCYERQSGHLEYTEAPKLLTWADLVRPDKDRPAPPAQSPTIPLKEIIEFPQTASQKVSRLLSLVTTEENRAETNIFYDDCEKFSFFGEDGFDSVKIETKIFKFAATNSDLVLFEIKKSQLHKILINHDLAPQIIRFLSQVTYFDQSNFTRCSRRFGDITVSLETNRSGSFIKMAKIKGGSIQIPIGHKKSSLLKFLNVFSNFVGMSTYVQDDSINLQHGSTIETEDPTSISKLIFNYQIYAASTENLQVHCPGKQLQLPLIQAYSDASDSFEHSDDSFFTDDFLGHATENDRRPPISYPEEIRKSKFNRAICRKAILVNSENCLPTDNLNTQLKIYRKSQKNKRRHRMKTRSQSRDFPWD
ncbi:unnamed protein product [Cuscuta epithymum]|uniref:Uncharacterized protein n=2 Tax=Cuscuta epithymum TaxID=186058 RepID=A0AAV0F4U2_9ASTE|nr:unnamed protein product [Cuscuta epithymum]